MVMVRPMSGLNALSEAMGREFERVGIAPPAGRVKRPAIQFDRRKLRELGQAV